MHLKAEELDYLQSPMTDQIFEYILVALTKEMALVFALKKQYVWTILLSREAKNITKALDRTTKDLKDVIPPK